MTEHDQRDEHGLARLERQEGDGESRTSRRQAQSHRSRGR
jgi:hypothetical protein